MTIQRCWNLQEFPLPQRLSASCVEVPTNWSSMKLREVFTMLFALCVPSSRAEDWSQEVEPPKSVSLRPSRLMLEPFTELNQCQSEPSVKLLRLSPTPSLRMQDSTQSKLLLISETDTLRDTWRLVLAWRRYKLFLIEERYFGWYHNWKGGATYPGYSECIELGHRMRENDSEDRWPHHERSLSNIHKIH